jgi:hypothetical protein
VLIQRFLHDALKVPPEANIKDLSGNQRLNSTINTIQNENKEIAARHRWNIS